MPSGMASVIENSLERIVSDDLNRAQLWKERDLSEALRFLLDDYAGTDDLDACGLSDEQLVVGTPLRGIVLGGLVVLPQIGNLSLVVAPGVALFVNPDSPANPDLSPYQYLRDSGVPAVGQLLLTANSSGSTRVDVVECQPILAVTETDNRDFFDAVSGLFVPKTVAKAQAAQLTYRVRAGTPGAGYPGNAAGWFPLAVARVPDGTTSNDTVTFWDVREHAADRAYGLSNAATDYPRRLRGTLHAVSPANVTGIADLVFKGRRVGGSLRSGTDASDATLLNLTDSKNRDPNFAANTSLAATLALCFPFGLPRWARYTDTNDAGPRLPRSPRGIPIVTNAAFGCNRTPITGVVLPPGLLGSVTTPDAVQAFALVAHNNPTLEPVWGDDADGYYVKAIDTVSMTTVPTNGAVATLTSGIDFPSGAKAILCRFFGNIVFNATGISFFTFFVSDKNVFSTPLFSTIQTMAATSGTVPLRFDVWLPLSPPYSPQGAGNSNPHYDVGFSTAVGADVVNGTQFFQLLGWKL